MGRMCRIRIVYVRSDSGRPDASAKVYLSTWIAELYGKCCRWGGTLLLMTDQVFIWLPDASTKDGANFTNTS
jgi:hypothetical protein